jgi:hypothetical protein
MFLRCAIAALTFAKAFCLAASPLYVRGYTLIPEPHQITLKAGDFEFDGGWQIQHGQGIADNDPAIQSLREQVSERYNTTFSAGGHGVIELTIRSGAVSPGHATDRDTTAVAGEAYRLELTPKRIAITANAAPGLFYGVQTLVQLVQTERGKMWLPEGEIVDWPDVALREVFWDQSEHLDRFEVLEQAVRRAAFFKINAIALRLNQHFEHASAPALVDPYALSPSQLQQLTDFALRHYVQIIPYLDGPAHVNFILERDEYKNLREFPEMAFEMCSTNPATYRLLEGLAQDLIDANKGGKYFHLSTDEGWFIGKADNSQCNEAGRAKELGSPSKLWVEYAAKMTAFLEAHGRKVIFWGEEPMQAEDIPSLPATLINGEVYSTRYNKAFRQRGIRQMIYTNSQPLDPLFPFYSVASPREQLHPSASVAERAAQVFNEISYTSARNEADIAGAGVYAWGDSGPHPETFWLGYAVGASAAWHPGASDPRELAHRFFKLYYGQGSAGIARVYQLMSTQAQFWASSWDSEPSGKLPLIFGYSYGIGPFTPHISTLPLPGLPTPDILRSKGNWREENARRLELAWKSLGENDELLDLLYSYLPAVQFNRHNLEVYLSIARLCRQNLLMLKGMDELSSQLEKAQEQAAKLNYGEAVAALDATLDVAAAIRDERNQALQQATATWYETWQPRVREANGRRVAREPQRFVDTAPTVAARRAQEGLAYLIERELALPFGEWVNELQRIRNEYAAAHKLNAREGKFDWQDTVTLHSGAINREL